MKNILLAIIGLVVLVGGVFAFSVYGVGYLKRGTADFRGETAQIEKTKADGNYRIASYDHFFDKCASVQSIEGKIKNMEDELSGTKNEQREMVLNTSITAAKNKRTELISSYNADARKEATRGQFRASDLPYSLDLDAEETICEIF